MPNTIAALLHILLRIKNQFITMQNSKRNVNETGTFETYPGCFILNKPSNTRLILKRCSTLSRISDTNNEVYL